jgi:branched-chain amino acid transport system substrate-binding protein
MVTKSRGAALAVCMVGAMVLAGCAGGAGGPQEEGGDISNDKVVIGVLNDQSGVYKDLSGPNSVVAVNMAIADYKAKYGDKAVAKKIEVVTADHQNKPDIANTKAQEMYERQNADIILDVPTSSAALAVATVAKQHKKLFIDVGAGTTALTGASCNAYTFHWAYDTQMLAKGAASLVQNGGKNWSIVYPDYAFGQDMQKSFNEAVKDAGGTVQQSIPTPFPNDNFATFITKAASSNPDVIGTMAAGGDLINFVKQFNQSGLRDQAKLAVGLMFITDIHSLGVDQFAGTSFTDAWYWNFDKTNRAWADKFTKKTNTRPSFAHAANYSAATQYLEAIQRAGTDGSDAVIKQLEGKKFNDVFLRNGEVRADHNVIHDTYLAKVKTKDQVKEPWDYEEITNTIPAKEAYGPVSADCKL